MYIVFHLIEENLEETNEENIDENAGGNNEEQVDESLQEDEQEQATISSSKDFVLDKSVAQFPLKEE